MLKIEGYQKLVGSFIQSGGFLLTVTEVFEGGDNYKFLIEIRESGIVKDYVQLLLEREKMVSDFSKEWYSLKPGLGFRFPTSMERIAIFEDEISDMKRFGELVLKYARNGWSM